MLKSFSEPAIALRQELQGCVRPALLLPQASETHGGAQFQGLRLLLAGYIESLLHAERRFSLTLRREVEQQLPFEPIQLGLIPTFPSVIHQAQSVSEHGQVLPQPALHADTLQPTRQENTAATVLTLWPDRQRDLAVSGQCPLLRVPASPGPCRAGSSLAPPTAQTRVQSRVPRLRLTVRKRGLWLVAMPMQDGSPTQGPHQAVRMLDLPGQGERSLAPLQGLVWIAEVPEGLRRIDQARHPRVLLHQGDLGTMELRFIDRHPEFRMLPSPRKLAENKQGLAQHDMAPQEWSAR